MLGIKTTKQESSIDIWDDKWIPYIEENSGVNISIQYSPEEPELYIGKVLASWNRYDDPDDWQTPMYTFQIEHQDFIYSFYKFIEDHIPALKDKRVSLLFFTTAN
jgi:hypothetical protein